MRPRRDGPPRRTVRTGTRRPTVQPMRVGEASTCTSRARTGALDPGRVATKLPAQRPIHPIPPERTACGLGQSGRRRYTGGRSGVSCAGREGNVETAYAVVPPAGQVGDAPGERREQAGHLALRRAAVDETDREPRVDARRRQQPGERHRRLGRPGRSAARRPAGRRRRPGRCRARRPGRAARAPRARRCAGRRRRPPGPRRPRRRRPRPPAVPRRGRAGRRGPTARGCPAR